MKNILSTPTEFNKWISQSDQFQERSLCVGLITSHEESVTSSKEVSADQMICPFLLKQAKISQLML